jgi:hypothetical protein
MSTDLIGELKKSKCFYYEGYYGIDAVHYGSVGGPRKPEQTTLWSGVLLGDISTAIGSN